jgi:hypothetical protein
MERHAYLSRDVERCSNIAATPRAPRSPLVFKRVGHDCSAAQPRRECRASHRSARHVELHLEATAGHARRAPFNENGAAAGRSIHMHGSARVELQEQAVQIQPLRTSSRKPSCVLREEAVTVQPPHATRLQRVGHGCSAAQPRRGVATWSATRISAATWSAARAAATSQRRHGHHGRHSSSREWDTAAVYARSAYTTRGWIGKSGAAAWIASHMQDMYVELGH